MEMSYGWAYIIRAGPRFGLYKLVPILIAHLLINIKKKNIKLKSNFFFFFFFLMQNQCYIVFFSLNYIKKEEAKCNPGYGAL